MTQTQSDTVKRILPKRSADANKYSVGSLLCICGSFGMAGAAVLSAKAALRMGVGFVRCAVPKSIYPIVSAAVPEAVFAVLPENDRGTLSSEAIPQIVKLMDKSSAVLLGCGLGRNKDTEAISQAVLTYCKKPLVIDADGINCTSKHIDLLSLLKAPAAVTPHEGEMQRLTGINSKEIHLNRETVAREFSEKYGVTTVLKGKETLITAKGEETALNPTGNPGLAAAGSGDVLAGMIASLCAQGASPFDASVAGAYIHGLAGDLGREKFTEYSLLPTDVIEFIPGAVKEVLGIN
ncbi:MAG: NAD(P)H-hydrate dehydratase [Ruminococcus sp.]